jgi:tetratricopeptide (TPR) repeat protein
MAERKHSFKFRAPQALPAGTPVSDAEVEALLLQRMHDATISDSEFVETLWQLSGFYRRIGRRDLATGIVQIVMESVDDPEQRARGYLSLGQMAEEVDQYDVAIDQYAKGLALQPTTKLVAYLLHNNIGYSLNQEGKYAEAERYCRQAIELDSDRANAFKNLGISLAGQHDAVGAAWAYIEATRADASDPRASRLLEQLVSDHPGLPSQFPGILAELESCKRAVVEAEQRIQVASSQTGSGVAKRPRNRRKE